MRAAIINPTVIRFATFLETEYQGFLIDRIDGDLQFVIGDRVDDLVEPRRQPLHQVFQFQDTAEEISRRQTFHEALLHDLGGVAADRSVRVEVRLDGAADLIEIQQRFAQHGELSRDPDAVFPGKPA